MSAFENELYFYKGHRLTEDADLFVNAFLHIFPEYRDEVSFSPETGFSLTKPAVRVYAHWLASEGLISREKAAGAVDLFF